MKEDERSANVDLSNQGRFERGPGRMWVRPHPKLHLDPHPPLFAERKEEYEREGYHWPDSREEYEVVGAVLIAAILVAVGCVIWILAS